MPVGSALEAEGKGMRPFGRAVRLCLRSAASYLIILWVPVCAQQMRTPTVEPVVVDWSATAQDFEVYRPLVDAGRAQGWIGLLTRAEIAILKLRFATLRGADLQATVNLLASERFANIAASPTPVLLPVDMARFLRDRLSSQGAAATGVYLAGFSAFKYFRPGPAGYDAQFNMPAEEASRSIGRPLSEDVAVTLSGSSLFYILDDPTPPSGVVDERFPELSADVRRLVHDRAIRFTFRRYGAPYLVSIDCRLDSIPGRSLSCSEADTIGAAFLKSLQLAGGAPPKRPLLTTPLDTVKRPRCPDASFAYHSPGDITPGSGFANFGGKVDFTVYARMSFPVASSRAYANSQVFMNGGECLSDPPNSPTTIPVAPKFKGDTYACKQNPAKLLTFFEGAQENYDYPWRDNFCESRDWPLGQCPGNMGHQGQDIRPDRCYPVSDTSVRCEPYRHRINAVRDGVVVRERGREALYLIVNTPTEHVRFRYLHMNPAQLDRDGMVTGRELGEGERIGVMGNFLDGQEAGTTYHLHFDLQVPTRDGWLFVSPYMTLVAAYERMIGRYGAELKADGSRAAPAPASECQ